MVYFDITDISLLQSILFDMDKKFQKHKYAAVVDLILYICTYRNCIWNTVNFRDITQPHMKFMVGLFMYGQVLRYSYLSSDRLLVNLHLVLGN